MKILLKRKLQTEKASLGDMYIDGKWVGFTLEDVFREIKIPGETRIPAGIYEVKFREVLSGMTKKYRNRYPGFFSYHLELQGVPGYDYVYIHAGNKPEHTEGCILVGFAQDAIQSFIGNSGSCFSEVYQKISHALNTGNKVTIEVKDE